MSGIRAPWAAPDNVYFWLTIQVGVLLGSLSLPVRLLALVPVVLVLFGIADVVADKVDQRLEGASSSRPEAGR